MVPAGVSLAMWRWLVTDEPKKNVIPTPEEMAEAVEKDRGCCFLMFYRVAVGVQNFHAVTVVCPECRIEWHITRLNMTMAFTPVGLKPLVDVVKELPGTRH